jgi:energy-coupling factor transport system substrate-specific component
MSADTSPVVSPPDAARPASWRPALRIGTRPAVVLALASLAGLATFFWPLVIAAPTDGGGGAPFIFLAILPVLVVLVLAELSHGGLDSKAVAVLGVLAAVGAALRPLGAGTAGLETVFFLLVLAGRVFGPGFGFVLGTTTLFASALLTAGVGPWLPFQMIAAAWVGLGAGLLPGRARLRGRAEIIMLCVYGAISAQMYGLLMNLSGWPYGIAAAGTELSYVPGAGPIENLHRFLVYSVTTSSLGWDLGRSITNVVLIALVGPAVLAALRRAARRARFSDPG